MLLCYDHARFSGDKAHGFIFLSDLIMLDLERDDYGIKRLEAEFEEDNVGKTR
jgi:hypothetical protein